MLKALLQTDAAATMDNGFRRQQNSNGERVYSEFSSGNYVKRTEQLKGKSAEIPIPADATILYLLTYLDSTWLTSTGKKSSKPLSLSLGNFTKQMLSLDKSKMVSCLVIDSL